MIKERVFKYGEHLHGIGVISEPDDLQDSPMVVMLNAGLSPRAEPYRMNVLLGRRLAALGYIALRVDLSGKGDSPARPHLTNRESVALDWSYIKTGLEKRYGKRTTVIFGLCSGADNGIKLAAEDTDIKGLILLDPISRQDAGFRRRDLLRKLTNPLKWTRMHRILGRRVQQHTVGGDPLQGSPMDLRDEPTDHDVDQCFNRLNSENGRVLAVFTSQALFHYNQTGQFAGAMGIPGLETITEEVFWPNAKHIFPAESHRNRLIDAVATWAERHLAHFQASRKG
jgi:hypothetical protein